MFGVGLRPRHSFPYSSLFPQNSMKKILSLCSVVALSATVSAQTSSPAKTIPTGYLKTSGNYYQWGAFRYSQGRHQSLYSPTAAGTTTGPIVLTNLWLRPDENTKNLKAFVREWEVVVSSKGAKWKAPAKTSFAGNHGTDKVVFMKRKKFNLPAVGASAGNPAPWAASLKGDKPFVVLKGEGMVIDVKSYSKTYDYLGWYADAVNDASTDYGRYTSLNSGCPTTFYHYSGYYYVGATSPWYTYGYTRGSGDVAFTWLGAKKTNIKITSACTLFTLPLVVHPKVVKTTSTSGSTYSNRWQWGKIPASMGGKTLISQMAAVTPKGQLKLSRGIEVTFGKGKVTPKGMKVIYGYGSGYNPDSAAPKYGPYDYGVIFGRN